MAFPVDPGETAWFALTVKPRHETVVAQTLSERGLETYLPIYDAVRRWSDRTKIVPTCLFPRYVFCRFGYERQLEILQLPSVFTIVGFGDSPAPIPEEEIEAVRTILASGMRAVPWPFLKVGHQVRITEGALTGVEGILLREKDTLRVVVSVDLLQRSVAVEIDRTIIRPS